MTWYSPDGYARFFEQTYPAAQKNVEKLVAAGILKERAGTWNPKVFVAGEILRLLDEPLADALTAGRARDQTPGPAGEFRIVERNSIPSSRSVASRVGGAAFRSLGQRP